MEIFESVDQVAAFIDEFEACRLPKSRWTHAAHLVVGAWYLQKLGMARALEMTRHRISRYNESTGTPNSDHEGYHETITRAYLAGIADHMEKRPGLEFVDIIKSLLGSPLASSSWPLQFYTRDRLFSVDARHQWVEPDLAPIVEAKDGSI